MRKYLVAALIIAGLSAACEGTTSYLHSTNDPDADTGDAGIPGTEDDAGEPDAGRPDGGRPDAGPPKSGESCNKAIDVSGGGVFQGSTLNAPYEYQTCNVGGVGVGARVYTLQTSTAQRFTVEATPTTAAFTHLSMAVKRDCD